MWLNMLGWTAAAFFASSYFFKRAGALRGIQAAAAVMWIFYGIKIHSAPVVVSNLMVGVAAVYTSLRLARNKKSAAEGVLPEASASVGYRPRVHRATWACPASGHTG